ncbi:hypothetical protein [Synechococcus sp. O70.2]|jgi:hypothetical protein|uniref:hypothetical protein n=1 Tax=Synechococcus sp. O70.2 TaxID=2964533 RepID=UPI0039C078FC
MNYQTVWIKEETRNHQGHFIPQSEYILVEANCNGWALICADNARCYYVDPEALQFEPG